MGFKLSFQQQTSHSQQDLPREKMYFFWFVYLSGKAENSAAVCFSCEMDKLVFIRLP